MALLRRLGLYGTMLAAFASTGLSAEERNVEISNSGAVAIVLVTAVSLDHPKERLGFSVRIEPGESNWFDFSDQKGSCTFSIHASFENGEQTTVSPIDVCDEYWVMFE